MREKTRVVIDPGSNGCTIIYKPGSLKQEKTPKGTGFKRLLESLDNPEVIIESQSLFASDDKFKMMRIQPLIQQQKEISTICEIMEVNCIEVSPRTWQSKLKLVQKGEEKQERKRRYKKVAQYYYPDLKVTLRNCDALLMLIYILNYEK